MSDVGFVNIKVAVSDYARAAKGIEMANNGETYRGMFRDEITGILDKSYTYARNIVHVDTGHLRDAIDWKYDSHRMKGWLYVSDRTAYNTSRNVRREPQKYAVFEENRGGDHAFMYRTLKEKTEPLAFKGFSRAVMRIRWP